ncbi:MAG: hypothetical protein AXW15_07915 [Neptuniibacter sp. Phe_28]|nr:MAG: hypothetical protein AXW15_07915 [Neptuniibacter sp. Phe_28]
MGNETKRLLMSLGLLYSISTLSISVIFAGFGVPVAEESIAFFFCLNGVAGLTLIFIGTQAIISTFNDEQQP